MFSKRQGAFIHYLLALLVAFSLMLCDTRLNALGYVRTGLSWFISPIQYVIDYPVRLIDGMTSLMTSKHALIKENMQLKYQETLLQAQLQKYKLLRDENIQLKELLSATPSPNMKATAAHILAVETSYTRQLLAINKGKRDGVFIGQPVLDANGVMGQIVDAGYMTSTVMLISDAKSAVPVRNDRTGERGILMGSNDLNTLVWPNLPKTSAIQTGDRLVTSGLGRKFPEGYPVARVERVDDLAGEEFIKVIAKPVASLQKSRLVLLVWPSEEEMLLTSQIKERLKAMEENTA